MLFNEIGERNGRRVVRNVTPDKIASAESEVLYKLCDDALIEFIDALQPETLVAVGVFAENCLKRLFGERKKIKIIRMIHPSPASPPANRDFAGIAARQLIEAEVWTE